MKASSELRTRHGNPNECFVKFIRALIVVIGVTSMTTSSSAQTRYWVPVVKAFTPKSPQERQDIGKGFSQCVGLAGQFQGLQAGNCDLIPISSEDDIVQAQNRVIMSINNMPEALKTELRKTAEKEITEEVKREVLEELKNSGTLSNKSEVDTSMRKPPFLLSVGFFGVIMGVVIGFSVRRQKQV